LPSVFRSDAIGAVGSAYGPYVPTVRLAKILNEYMDWLDISRDEVARELSAATGKTYEAWVRRIYSILNGESETVRFQTADEILTSLYLADRWYSELFDIYEAAA
jgi:hypothetical protein